MLYNSSPGLSDCPIVHVYLVHMDVSNLINILEHSLMNGMRYLL